MELISIACPTLQKLRLDGGHWEEHPKALYTLLDKSRQIKQLDAGGLMTIYQFAWLAVLSNCALTRMRIDAFGMSEKEALTIADFVNSCPSLQEMHIADLHREGPTILRFLDKHVPNARHRFRSDEVIDW